VFQYTNIPTGTCTFFINVLFCTCSLDGIVVKMSLFTLQWSCFSLMQSLFIAFEKICALVFLASPCLLKFAHGFCLVKFCFLIMINLIVFAGEMKNAVWSEMNQICSLCLIFLPRPNVSGVIHLETRSTAKTTYQFLKLMERRTRFVGFQKT